MSAREIKFRAWDIKNKKMYDVKAIGWYEDGMSCNDKPILQTEKDDERNFNSNILKEDVRNFILEQYTGLKDKNGKEIFEGDKIHRETKYNIDNSDYEIIYDYGMWLAKRPNTYVKNEDVLMKLAELDMKEIEVIGNIHDSEVDKNEE